MKTENHMLREPNREFRITNLIWQVRATSSRPDTAASSHGRHLRPSPAAAAVAEEAGDDAAEARQPGADASAPVA